jgi:hypothetical protein
MKPTRGKYNVAITMAWLQSYGIPLPEREWCALTPRKFRFDFAWPSHKLALEVDGGVFTHQAHGSIGGILRTMEKDNVAAALGWRVMHVIPDKLLKIETAQMIKAAMEWHVVRFIPTQTHATGHD